MNSLSVDCVQRTKKRSPVVTCIVIEERKILILAPAGQFNICLLFCDANEVQFSFTQAPITGCRVGSWSNNMSVIQVGIRSPFPSYWMTKDVFASLSITKSECVFRVQRILFHSRQTFLGLSFSPAEHSQLQLHELWDWGGGLLSRIS